ncbi:hypothetical protein C8Q74DRAFT_1294581 [Fomes fomentarius]|nr:hypothetical protein C8Q74DRAFT_1294581 [Fomes fomentarius]
MAAPDIRISTPPRCSLHSATDHSKQERSGKGDALRRSPTPSTSSARGSTTSPQGSLTLPSIYHRRGSSTSIPSTVTLTDNVEAPCSTVFGGGLTADPESEIAILDEATNDAHNETKPPEVEVEVEVFLAPIPVRHVRDNRYFEREPLLKDGVHWNKYKTIPAKNRIQSRPQTAGRWEPCVHPEGQLYFRFQNFYTNVYLYDEDNLKYIDATVALLLDEISEHPELVLEHIEVGLHLMVDDENDHLGCYYLADKVKEEVFWLEDVDEGFMNKFEGVSILSQEHLTLIARHFYWEHVIMFPHGRQYPLGRFADLQAELNYWILDRELSPTSTVPYSSEDIYRFIQILRDVRSLQSEERTPTPYVIVFAALKSSMAHERFIRYHGERYAQLDDNRSVHDPLDTESSLWFKIIIPLLFFTPHNYGERLRILYLDKKVNYTVWRKFIAELGEDWRNSIIPSTVILSANVGFLAIQSVDKDQANRSAGQVVSYISLILSIGNIFACAILSGILHRSLHQTASDAAQYLTGRMETNYGREKLAIVLSIPTVFFLWGLLTFLISIVWLCFSDTGITTRLVIGLTIVVSALCIGTVIHTGRGPPPGYNAFAEKFKKTQELVKKVKKVPKKIRRRISTMSKDMRKMSQDAVNALNPRRKMSRKHTGQNTLDSNGWSTPDTNDGGPDVARKRVEGEEIRKKFPRRSIDIASGVLHLPLRFLRTPTDSSPPNSIGSTGALDGSEEGGGTRETSVENMV